MQGKKRREEREERREWWWESLEAVIMDKKIDSNCSLRLHRSNGCKKLENKKKEKKEKKKLT